MRLHGWRSVCLVAFIAACGGGGAEPKYVNEFLIVDRTPAQGSTNVHVGTEITATFSRFLDPATVNDGNVIVTGTGGVSLGKTLSLTDENRTIVITLAAAPALPADVTIVFTSGIQDVLGNPFTRAEWTFSMPEWWEPFGETPANGSSSVDLDASGLPVVAWCASDGVHVSRWSAGGWTPVGQVLSLGGAGGCGTPSVAYSSLGDTLAVAWEETTSAGGSDRAMYVAVWNGTEWRNLSGAALSASQAVATATVPYGMSPTLALDRTAVIYVAARVGLVVRAWQGTVGATSWTPLGGALNRNASKQAGSPSAWMPHGVVVGWTEDPASLPNVGHPYARPLASGDAYAASWESGTWSLVGLGKLNATGRIAYEIAVARSPSNLAAFADFDPAVASSGALAVRTGTVSRGWTNACAGTILDETSQWVDSIALATAQGTGPTDPSGPPWIMYAQGGRLVVKSCETTWTSAGNLAEGSAVGPLFLDFARPTWTPTVAYVEAVTTPWRTVIKQPNR